MGLGVFRELQADDRGSSRREGPGRRASHSVGSVRMWVPEPALRTDARERRTSGAEGAQRWRGRCWMEGGTGVVQILQVCDQALPAHSRRRGPKPERGGRSWPHVIPVGFGDLEASGGWIGKWGKGQSVAPAVALLQGQWAEDGWRPAGPDTHRPALGWLSATQGRPRDLEEDRAASAVLAGCRAEAPGQMLSLTQASAALGTGFTMGWLSGDGESGGWGCDRGSMDVRPLRANRPSLHAKGRGSWRRYGTERRGGSGLSLRVSPQKVCPPLFPC